MSSVISELEELFADELLIFVMDEMFAKHGESRNLNQPDKSSLFTTPIQYAVRQDIEKHDVAIKNIFNHMLEHGNLNTYFGAYSRLMTSKLFFRGYNEREFVQFCAVVCKLAVLAYRHEYRDCLMLATAAILNVIKLYKAASVFPPDGLVKLSNSLSVA